MGGCNHLKYVGKSGKGGRELPWHLCCIGAVMYAQVWLILEDYICMICAFIQADQDTLQGHSSRGRCGEVKRETEEDTDI